MSQNRRDVNIEPKTSKSHFNTKETYLYIAYVKYRKFIA